MNQERDHTLRFLARLGGSPRSWPMVLLVTASAIGMACLIPWALREHEHGLALLLAAVAPLAGLGAYSLMRQEQARIRQARAITEMRLVPASLPVGLQVSLLAARQLVVVVQGGGSPTEIVRAVGPWSGTLTALDGEDRRLLRSRGVNALSLELSLHDLVNLGSPRGAVLAAQIFEATVLGSQTTNVAKHPVD